MTNNVWGNMGAIRLTYAPRDEQSNSLTDGRDVFFLIPHFRKRQKLKTKRLILYAGHLSPTYSTVDQEIVSP